MLDFVFLVLMVIVILKAIKGDYNELLCNISLVVGVLAGILGIISAIFNDFSDFMGVLNVLVILIAFLLRPVAQHFAQLYQNKLDEQRRIIEQEIERAQANYHRPHPRDNSYVNAEPTPGADPVPQGNGGLPSTQPLQGAPETHENSVLPKSGHGNP